ncbi:MAG: hypothetical protein Q8R96_11665 [Bacteroidota bacterium]|nr:hypothetical protein [Bacteroidota bacterium]
MKYEMVQLRKGVFELDFVKKEDGNNYTCATSLANKLGMSFKNVNRIINGNKILKDASSKLRMHDTKNRNQSMVFIHSDHFLYFMSKIEGLKGAEMAPDFVQNLIVMYPLFLKELQRRAQFLFYRMEKNHIDQTRINKMERIRNSFTTEISRLKKEISLRNIEDVIYDQYADGSVQPTLELEDHFYRNIVEVEFEIVNEFD